MRRRSAAFKKSNKNKNFKLGGMKKANASFKRRSSVNAQIIARRAMLLRVERTKLAVAEEGRVRPRVRLTEASRVGT